MQERLDAIKHIQNGLWLAYKEFIMSPDHSMRPYNGRVMELSNEYRGADKDAEMRIFCENLIISWAPIMNSLVRGFEKRRDDAG